MGAADIYLISMIASIVEARELISCSFNCGHWLLSMWHCGTLPPDKAASVQQRCAAPPRQHMCLYKAIRLLVHCALLVGTWG